MRFYHIDIEHDVVGSARFFKLAYRLPIYDGAITARAQEEQEANKKRNPAKALRTNPAAVVNNDVSALDGIVDLRN